LSRAAFLENQIASKIHSPLNSNPLVSGKGGNQMQVGMAVAQAAVVVVATLQHEPYAKLAANILQKVLEWVRQFI
jgi:hypothetical protein